MRISILAVLTASLIAVSAQAADAPGEIKLGTLYASSGPFSDTSVPLHRGLKFWVDQKNEEGGVYAKPFDKKIPVKLVAHDDRGDAAAAASLYRQLITEDKVDILIADSGPALTSVAVPIAREHKMLLIDQNGLESAFFTSDNPYIVLIDEPVYSMWPKPLTDLLDRDGPGLGIKRVALLYSTNDFTETQADAVRKFIKGSNSGLDIVFDQGVPTATSNYTALLEAIRAANPDAVLHFGYVSNDVALLRNVLELGIKFKFLFCIYPSVLAEPFEKDVGNKALEYVFAYVASSQIAHAPNFGMSLKEYRAAWHEKYARLRAKFDFNAVAGYTTGLVLEKALAMARSLDQLELRRAILGLSGQLKTLDGAFELDPDTGAQVGELESVGQLVPDGNGGLRLVTVWPPDLANGKPIYPRP